jgi:hypothetical protein
MAAAAWGSEQQSLYDEGSFDGYLSPKHFEQKSHKSGMIIVLH